MVCALCVCPWPTHHRRPPRILQTRSFQYVDDLIRGMVAVMEGDELGPFNVGNPGEFTMLELAEVREQFGLAVVGNHLGWGGVCSCALEFLHVPCRIAGRVAWTQ